MGKPSVDWPLFPDEFEQPCGWYRMVATNAKPASHLSLPSGSVEGLPKWLGHTWRIIGAQGSARAGVDTCITELVDRWGFSAVQRDIQGAPLDKTLEWARRVTSASQGA